MNRSEAKFHNTAIKMHDALIKLLDKHEFSDITVSEICREAGVNRSTFYAHYDNTYDLLQETRKDFFRSFLNSFENEDISLEHLSAEETSVFVSPKYLVPFLEFMKQNRKMFQTYMNNLDFIDTEEVFSFFRNTVFAPIIYKFHPANPNIILYMTTFFVQGVFTIVLEWLSNDCEDDVSLICEVIMMCVRPNAKYYKNT